MLSFPPFEVQWLIVGQEMADMDGDVTSGRFASNFCRYRSRPDLCDWPVLLIGIVAFISLISGYLPIPLELLKRRGRVVGIDFIFLTIDWCGAFFSLLALVAQNEFDVVFGTMYALWYVVIRVPWFSEI
jgi:hypothetical protein